MTEATPWWLQRYYGGRLISQVEMAVDRCALCDCKLRDRVTDTPVRDLGFWAYLCDECAREHGVATLGTVHRNIPMRPNVEQHMRS